jgi:hypothetical protein
MTGTIVVVVVVGGVVKGASKSFVINRATIVMDACVDGSFGFVRPRSIHSRFFVSSESNSNRRNQSYGVTT